MWWLALCDLELRLEEVLQEWLHVARQTQQQELCGLAGWRKHAGLMAHSGRMGHSPAKQPCRPAHTGVHPCLLGQVTDEDPHT